MAILATLNKTVTTAGTRVPLATTTFMVNQLTISPLATNTGTIYFGDSSVSSTVGLHIKKTDPSVWLGSSQIDGRDDSIDLSKVYIDASVNGDGVSILYLKS
jgi:hypothetical protein